MSQELASKIEGAEAGGGAAMRWLLPSVGGLLFVVLLFSLTSGRLASRLLRDGGTGWHIRTGQIILATHSIPRTDPFSETMRGHTWYAWEWLYDAKLGAVYNWAGLNGAVAWTAIIVAATFLLLFQMMRRRGTDLLTSIILFLLTLAVAMIHLFVRPHVVSWLFALVFWVVLERAHRLDAPLRLLWLPLLMVGWVNAHGGFLVGLVLIGIYWIDAIRRTWQAHREPGARNWLRGVTAVLSATVAATFVNPFGYALHVHIYRYLSDRFLMQHIEEFQPPNFHDLSPQCFLVLLVLVAIGVTCTRAKPSLREWLVLLFAAASGLYASRNLPVSGLLLALVGGPYLSSALGQRMRRGRLWTVVERMGAQDAALPGYAWAGAAVVALLLVAGNSGSVGGKTLIRADFESERFPVAAVDFMQAHGETEPVFSPDQWGGYLIYREYPAVLVDDRHDLYGNEFFKRYLRIVRIEPGWQTALSGMHPKLALLKADSKLAEALRKEADWHVEYQDRTAVLFRRVG